ncbi:MAG: pirin family protein [Flavobacteriaceae bacterium]|nr:pirin family protein [Flavobacteriaceae bacterium]MDB2315122.1 pirin family protein [Flavobacteriaceae bacterium]
MKTVYHAAATRGNANHGWLNANHSFSFAQYYNPERMSFGALRVLNDDTIAPGRGFGTHPHDNMEIITIPLEGDLEHKDSMGNVGAINEGEIQVMSAGTGVYHSEYNKNSDKPINLLQLWVMPKLQNVAPRYDQKSVKELKKNNAFYQVLSPNVDDDGMWIHQDAWFHLGDFDQTTTTAYNIKKKGNGVYVFVIEGSFSVGDQTLNKRDALGVWETEVIDFVAQEHSKILLVEVPMSF